MGRRPPPKAPVEQANGAPAPRLTARRRRAFIIAALAVPVLVMGAAEGVLRCCGFGGYARTLREIGKFHGATVVVTDTAGAATYFFANPEKTGSINEFTFLSPKPKGTVRVFMAGESAIKGFPQPMAFASSAFLEAMLVEAWPDRQVEVINLGTTAVASFPVLGMVSEALEYEPDLIVLYLGHNEFFGAYGVASVHRAGASPTAVRFRRWYGSLALNQALARVFASRSQSGRALMELVVGQARVGAEDPLREAAASTLKAHVSQLLERCAARKIPVIVCTVPSNERDLAPIGQADLSGLSGADQSRVSTLLAESAAQLATAPAAARQALGEVLALMPDHAGASFQLGKACFALGDHDAASRHFRRAIDVDPMPWRAPSQSNAALQQAVVSHGPGALLCDVQQAFRESSPGGCIGWELMDDHVHPTLFGQWLIARTLMQSMSALEGSLRVEESRLDAMPRFEDLARRLGDNPYDRYGAAHTMRVLFAIPFMRQANPSAYERFDAFCTEARKSMSPAVLEAVKEWEDPATHKGAQRPISGMVARVLMRDKVFGDAERLLAVAQRCVASFSSWNFEYLYLMLACREKLHGGLGDADRQLAADAIRRAEFMLSISPSLTGQVERFAGRLHQLRGEDGQAIPYLQAARKRVTAMDLVATDMALIEAYVKTGDLASARALAEQGIKHSGSYADMYRRFLAEIPRR